MKIRSAEHDDCLPTILENNNNNNKNSKQQQCQRKKKKRNMHHMLHGTQKQSCIITEKNCANIYLLWLRKNSSYLIFLVYLLVAHH